MRRKIKNIHLTFFNLELNLCAIGEHTLISEIQRNRKNRTYDRSHCHVGYDCDLIRVQTG